MEEWRSGGVEEWRSGGVEPSGVEWSRVASGGVECGRSGAEWSRVEPSGAECPREIDQYNQITIPLELII